jgi:hypothetical protein
MLFACGTCPICAVPVGFVKNPDTGLVFGACHSCECVWTDFTDLEQVDTSADVWTLAPRGVALAARADIERAGFAQFITEEHGDDSDWIWRGVLARDE